VTSRLGTGKWQTFFYSAGLISATQHFSFGHFYFRCSYFSSLLKITFSSITFHQVRIIEVQYIVCIYHKFTCIFSLVICTFSSSGATVQFCSIRFLFLIHTYSYILYSKQIEKITSSDRVERFLSPDFFMNHLLLTPNNILCKI
jgi:hypothetical protein